MELLEKDYVLGYWFASDYQDNCWYKIVVKRDGKWVGQYTFRYNKEESGDFNPFSGKDKKSIYTFTIDGDVEEEDVIKKINTIWKTICNEKYNGFSDMFLVQGDRQKFIDLAKEKDYLHFKVKKAKS